MSGLMKFVKQFLAKNDETVQAEHTPPESGGALQEPPPRQDGDDEYHQSVTSAVSPSSSRPSTVASRSLLGPPNDLTYEEWKADRNERVMNYMEQRIVLKQHRENIQDDEEVEEEYMVPENDELDVPYWSTQQEPSQSTSEGTPGSPAKYPPIRRKSIPHISEATHSISSVSQLSMYTKDLSLGLCRVEKVWGLRQIKRAEKQHIPNTSSPPTPSAVGTTGPFVAPFQSFEDDGPIGMLYKQLLSVQVTQLGSRDLPLLGRQDKPPQQLRIFFYNKYASAMSSFLTQFHTERVLLALDNVPAKCIFPYPPQNWFDEETLVPYCICIGDKSTMKMDNGHGEMVRVYFDDAPLSVTAALVPAKSDVMHEIELTSELIREGSIQLKDTSDMEGRYEAWEVAKHAEAEEEEDDAGATMQGDEDERPAPLGGRKPVPPPSTRVSPATPPRPPGRTRLDSPSGKRIAENRPEGAAADVSASPCTKRPRTTIVYHKLNELRKLHDEFVPSKDSRDKHPRANVYGTVLGFGAPSLTKTGEWMLSLSLVDETSPLPDASNESNDNEGIPCVTILIFCKERHSLPKFKSAGDILRLHRVGVQIWKDSLQLLGRASSSYVVSRPKEVSLGKSLANPEDWDFVPTARKEVTLEPQDTEICSRLWKWSQERLKSHPTMKFAQRFKLMDLTRQEQSETTAESSSGDLTVLVSAILPVPPALRTATSPVAFLRVWDGTGPPISDPLPVATATAAESTKKGDPSPEAVISIADAIQCWKSEPTDQRSEAAQTSSAGVPLEPPKALCGRVSNVAVWETPHLELISNTVKPGSFIRLRNVYEGKLCDGLRCLNLSSKSWLTPLPVHTFEIRVILEEHHARVQRKDPVNPTSGLLPLGGEAPRPLDETGPAPPLAASVEQPVAPALEPCIARCISEPAPSSLVVHFRITGTVPETNGESEGLHQLCVPGQTNGSVEFQFAVHLQDGTGDIDAIVSNDVGETLLGMKADVACQLPKAQVNETLGKLTHQDNRWQGEINSIELNGAKYFVLVAPSRA